MRILPILLILLAGCDDLSDSGESGYYPPAATTQGTGGMLGTGTGMAGGSSESFSDNLGEVGSEGGSEVLSDRTELPTGCTDAEMSVLTACKYIQLLTNPDEYQKIVYCSVDCDDPCTARECRRQCEEEFEDFYTECDAKYPLCSSLIKNFPVGCRARCSENFSDCIESEECENPEDPDTARCLEIYIECIDKCDFR